MIGTFSVSRRLLVVALVAAAGAGCDTADLKLTEDLTRYDASGTVAALGVRGKAGTVEIVATEGPVRVQEKRVYADLPPLTSHRVDGGTLYLLDQGCGAKADAGGECATHYRVEAPAGTTVTVAVGAAAVKLTGITGRLGVTTEVGSVTGSGLAGPTTVKSRVGDVELRYATAPSTVDVTNDVGATRVYLPADGTYRIDATTPSGATIDLPTTPTAAHKITLRATAGSITVSPAT